jgi:hypothetical protein
MKVPWRRSDRFGFVVEREEAGRILASVPGLASVMAYGANDDEAVRKVKSLALKCWRT